MVGPHSENYNASEGPVESKLIRVLFCRCKTKIGFAFLRFDPCPKLLKETSHYKHHQTTDDGLQFFDVFPDWLKTRQRRSTGSSKMPRRRASFYGFVGKHDGTKGKTVVSFPGAYHADWDMLVARSDKLKAATETSQNAGQYSCGSTCCVFLPPGSGLFGLHSPNTVDEEAKKHSECWCSALYGAKQEFGCRWFYCWLQQLEQAVERGHELVVVFKANQTGEGTSESWPPKLACTAANQGLPGLGVSQRREVAWILRNGNTISQEDIIQFRRPTIVRRCI